MTGFWPLLEKEVRVEARSRELVAGGLVVTILVLVIASAAWGFGPDSDALAAGTLWVALVFGGMLSLGRSVHRERDRGTWEALALLPVDRGAVFFAKATANFLVLMLFAAVAVPVYGLLFERSLLGVVGPLTPVVVLGTIGVAALGTLLAGASAHGRAREILLPILLLPLLIPLLIAAVSATERVVDGAPFGSIMQPVQLLIAFDTIYLAIGWVAFDHLLGE